MKKCEQCGAELNDNTTFCTRCGAKLEQMASGAVNSNETTGAQAEAKGTGADTQRDNTYTYQQYTQSDPYNHTSEFDERDISNNKVVAMLVYLMGALGIVIGLIAGTKSEYVAFHTRQAMKFKVISILMGIVTAVLFWTFIIPIAALVLWVVLWACKVIAFFSVCSGKACEPYVVRHLDFLK